MPDWRLGVRTILHEPRICSRSLPVAENAVCISLINVTVARPEPTAAFMSRSAAVGHVPQKPGISCGSASGRELARQAWATRELGPGPRVAQLYGTVIPTTKREDASMARSVIPNPRKRQPKRRYAEERPVLQLPLEAPQWREPPSREEGRTPGTERGVAVIDFFI